jgi:Spy/CpxP family protein refolding chaperone
MKKNLTLFLFVTIFCLINTSLAQPFQGKRMFGGANRGCGKFANLNLTEEQKQQLQSVMDPTLRQANRKLMQEKFNSLRQLLIDPNSSEESIRKANDELISTRNAMAQVRLSKLLTIRKVLSPSQLNTFLADRGPLKGAGASQGNCDMQE